MPHSFIPKVTSFESAFSSLPSHSATIRSYIRIKVGDDSVEINAQHKITIAHEASKLVGSAPERITLPNVFCVSDFDHPCLKRGAREPSNASRSDVENSP